MVDLYFCFDDFKTILVILVDCSLLCILLMLYCSVGFK